MCFLFVINFKFLSLIFNFNFFLHFEDAFFITSIIQFIWYTAELYIFKYWVIVVKIKIGFLVFVI